MRQQMLDENHLPAIFDFHNQPIRITLYVEDRVRLNEISMGITLLTSTKLCHSAFLATLYHSLIGPSNV